MFHIFHDSIYPLVSACLDFIQHLFGWCGGKGGGTYVSYSTLLPALCKTQIDNVSPCLKSSSDFSLPPKLNSSFITEQKTLHLFVSARLTAWILIITYVPSHPSHTRIICVIFHTVTTLSFCVVLFSLPRMSFPAFFRLMTTNAVGLGLNHS